MTMKKVMINGTQYPSIVSAAKAEGMTIYLARKIFSKANDNPNSIIWDKKTKAWSIIASKQKVKAGYHSPAQVRAFRTYIDDPDKEKSADAKRAESEAARLAVKRRRTIEKRGEKRDLERLLSDENYLNDLYEAA